MKRLFSAISVAVMGLLAAAGRIVADTFGPSGFFSIERHMQRQGVMLMAITSAEYPATSTGRMFNYRHLDDAAVPAAIVKNPGFRPRYVCVENITDRIKYEWYEGMAATDYIKTVAAGTRTLGTDSALAVVASQGSAPSITLAASQTLQNKQYEVHARS